MLTKANEVASKWNTPLADFAFKIVGGLVLIAVPFLWSIARNWVVAEVVSHPTIKAMQVTSDGYQTRIDTLEKLGTTHSSQLSSLQATNDKIASYLKENAQTTQSIQAGLQVLTQRVQDSQDQAKENFNRLDARLDSVQAHQR